MKLSKIDFSNAKGLPGLVRLLSKLFREVSTILNGGILFTDNFDGKVVTIDFNSANVDVPIEHNLGRTPRGYLALKKTDATDLYDGVQSFNEDFIYLRSSSISEVKVLVF